MEKGNKLLEKGKVELCFPFGSLFATFFSSISEKKEKRLQINSDEDNFGFLLQLLSASPLSVVLHSSPAV